MIKIPQNGKYNQPNNSDLFGNIWYSKNINLDEEGYLKLASRTVSLISEDENADFGTPTSLGRYTSGSFFITTHDSPFILEMGSTEVSIVKDTDSDDASPPTISTYGWGKWWRNRWYVTTRSGLYYKTQSTGNWTNTGVSLTSSKQHPLCPFETAGTLLIGNSNTVKQIDSSHATTGLDQLTLSTDYEIIGIAYNNNLVGIATRLDSTVEGQNKEACFFVWDGNESSANYGYYVGSDSILSITPYKSSFAIITRAGELLYFNGGGFDKLASFPIYYSDVFWGEPINLINWGDAMVAEGDLIYINVNSGAVENGSNIQIENMIGGIWVYDPAVGLYHKYAPSISKANSISVAGSDVNTTTNIMTTSSTIPSTGNPIIFLDGSIGGLLIGKTYYVIKNSPTTFQVAETETLANEMTAIDLTSSTGTHYFMTVNIRDYGQARTSRSGGIGFLGEKSYIYNDILFGGNYYDEDSYGTTQANLNLSVEGFKNIGYFITPKIVSQNITDIFKKLYIKYRPLKSTDTITLKVKDKDVIDLPEFANCTVTSTTELSTTSYIPASYGTTETLECEVVNGPGAGRMVAVSSITESSGTYTITLAEAIPEIATNDKITIKLDNWTELLEITSADSEDWKEIPLATTSKWLKIKVILTGSDISIEELQVINDTHLPSA